MSTTKREALAMVRGQIETLKLDLSVREAVAGRTIWNGRALLWSLQARAAELQAEIDAESGDDAEPELCEVVL